MMIRRGETLTFTVIGRVGEYLPRTESSVRQYAIDGLTPFFDVLSVNLKTKTFLNDPLHVVTNWEYTATVRVTVKADYGDVRDVDSVIAHAFYNAAGELPTVTSDRERSQSPASTPQGLTLTGAIGLVAVALVATAVIKVS
jgi:hypothetical protein